MAALRALAAAVPPMLEQALGYDLAIDSAWVGFHWTPAGDELVYDDGRCAGDGEWHAWLLFTRHPAIRPHLAGYHFGNSDEPAAHWLLLDRRARRLYAAPAGDAREHLRGQWNWLPTAGEAAPLDWAAIQAAWDEVCRRERQRPQAEIRAEIARRMAAQRQREVALTAWLDGQAHTERG